MSIKKTVLVASIALMTSSAFAGDIKPLHGFAGSLGASPLAFDVLKFTCGSDPSITIDHAHASIQDLAPVAKPKLNVRIAKWNGYTCGAFTAAADDPVDDDGLAGAEVARAMPAVGGKYCVLVYKTPSNQNAAPGKPTANGAEEYEIDTACAQEGNEFHPEPTFNGYFINQ